MAAKNLAEGIFGDWVTFKVVYYNSVKLNRSLKIPNVGQALVEYTFSSPLTFIHVVQAIGPPNPPVLLPP